MLRGWQGFSLYDLDLYTIYLNNQFSSNPA